MKYLATLCVLLPAVSLAAGPTLEELQNDHHLTQNITTYGMGLGAQRWSPLTEINRETVANLVPAWSMALAS